MQRPREKTTFVGDLIKNTRKTIGMSQMDLADRLKVSYQQIQKYENGKSQLTIPRLKQVAKALGISPEEFLRSMEGLKEPSCATLSDKEVRLLKLFRKARTDNARDGILKVVDSLITIHGVKAN